MQDDYDKLYGALVLSLLRKHIDSPEIANKVTNNIMKLTKTDRNIYGREQYNEGYKQGVSDEIECMETSGEHMKKQVYKNE